MTAILTSGTVATVHAKAPGWVIGLFAAGAGISVVLYLFAYLYLLFKDKDALRSETYLVQKMAIEKGLFGDSGGSAIEEEDDDTVPLLLASADDEKEDK